MKLHVRIRFLFRPNLTRNIHAASPRQANNIKKLLKELETYYNEVLQLDCPSSAVEPTAVAAGDATAVSRLLELVLGCAVQCDGKERCTRPL